MARKKDFTSVSGKRYDSMMSRCYREKDISFKSYSRNGIKVCSAWIADINSFRTWLLGELSRLEVSVETFVYNATDYQLDRIDPKGHYSPENCRLASRQENSRNKIKNRRTIVSAEGDTFVL